MFTFVCGEQFSQNNFLSFTKKAERKNVGPSIYVGIPERLLDIFLIFFGTYMSLMFK